MAVVITAKQVQVLREMTNAGMMDCKRALVEAEGDYDKAVNILREKGLAAAAKKATRIAAEGVVYPAVYDGGKKAVMLEVNSETDFVAKNEVFKTFVKDVADVIAKNEPKDVDALLECKFDDQYTVSEALKDKIFKIGENLKLRSHARQDRRHRQLRRRGHRALRGSGQSLQGRLHADRLRSAARRRPRPVRLP